MLCGNTHEVRAEQQKRRTNQNLHRGHADDSDFGATRVLAQLRAIEARLGAKRVYERHDASRKQEALAAEAERLGRVEHNLRQIQRIGDLRLPIVDAHLNAQLIHRSRSVDIEVFTLFVVRGDIRNRHASRVLIVIEIRRMRVIGKPDFHRHVLR